MTTQIHTKGHTISDYYLTISRKHRGSIHSRFPGKHVQTGSERGGRRGSHQRARV